MSRRPPAPTLFPYTTLFRSFGGGSTVLQVQPLAHFLARLEIGHALGGDVDGIAGTRVAALACVAVAGREGAEAPQFDAAALLQLADDRIEEGGDDALDLLPRQIGMIVAQLLDQLGTDHDTPHGLMDTGPERTPTRTG